MSLEFLLYSAVAGIAIALSIYMLARTGGELSRAVGAYMVGRFFSEASVAAESSGQFYAYLPPGICNSTINGSEVSTAYGDFYIPGRIEINNRSLCPDKMFASFEITYNDASGSDEVVRRLSR
jgi:hypothetical protein